MTVHNICQPLETDSDLIAALFRVMIRHDLGLELQVKQLLELGTRELKLNLGIVAQVVGDDYIVAHVQHPSEMPIEVGTTFEFCDTYCCNTLAADCPIGFHDAGGSDWRTHPAYGKFALEAYIGAPIRVHDSTWGTLNFSSPDKREKPFESAELEFIQLMADWLGSELERQQLERMLRHREVEFGAMFAASPIGIFMTDADGICLRVNPRYEEISGLSAKQALGTGWRKAIHPDDRERVFRTWQEAVKCGETYSHEHRVQRPDGEVIWTHVKAAEVRDGEILLGYVGTVEDITHRRATEEELRRAALYDSLTDLPNRALLLERIGNAIKRSSRDASYNYALLLLDFDGFKQVNDTHGHNTGDLLLISIAERLRSALRSTDIIARPMPARLGGDEFVVLLEDLSDPRDAITVAGRVLEQLRASHVLQTQTVRSTASIGVAWGNERIEDAESLIAQADRCLYQAKEAGGDRCMPTEDCGTCPSLEISDSCVPSPPFTIRP